MGNILDQRMVYRNLHADFCVSSFYNSWHLKQTDRHDTIDSATTITITIMNYKYVIWGS